MGISSLFLILNMTWMLVFSSMASEMATAIAVRGEVTVLSPGHWEARPVVVGQRLREDSSIVTKERSFVRLQLDDGTVISLAPQAKMVLHSIPSERPGVISLLTGALRAQTPPDPTGKNENHKLFLRTQTAALGVRGTDLMVNFNPHNEKTSSLTYQGEVEKTFLSEREYLARLRRQERRPEISRRDQGVELEFQTRERGIFNPSDTLEQVFEDHKERKVSVLAGQYSGTMGLMRVPSRPVKISPHQLTALYYNEDFETAAESNREVPSDLLEAAAQTVPPEGAYDPRKRVYAPKAGGFLDLRTGLYIPPDDEAELDRIRGVYVASSPQMMGRVHPRTGEYAPPPGLVLDARRGFVEDTRAPVENRAQLIAMRESLNQRVATDLILPPLSESALPQRGMRILTLREQFTKDIVDARFGFGQHELKYTDDPTRSNASAKSESALRFDLDWYHSSTKRFQLLTGLSVRSINFTDGKLFTEEAGLSKAHYDLRVGGRYYVTSRFIARAGLQLSQKYIADFSETDDMILDKSAIPALFVGGAADLIHTLDSRLRFGANADLFYHLSKDTGRVEAQSGTGARMGLFSRYYFNPRIWGLIGSEYSFHKQDLRPTKKSNLNQLGRQSNTELDFYLSIGVTI